MNNDEIKDVLWEITLRAALLSNILMVCALIGLGMSLVRVVEWLIS